MMKKLTQFSLVFGIPFAVISLGSNSAQAFTIAPAWDFEFKEDITGSGQISLDLADETENGFLVEELNFTLDFGDGNGSQEISLGNFSSTAPLRFNPADSDEELTSTSSLLGNPQSGWNLGFPEVEGVLNLDGEPGTGILFDDPEGVGGVGGFFSFTSKQQTVGVWTAKPVPEPTTVLGSTLALGLGYVLRKKSQSKFPRNDR